LVISASEAVFKKLQVFGEFEDKEIELQLNFKASRPNLGYCGLKKSSSIPKMRIRVQTSIRDAHSITVAICSGPVNSAADIFLNHFKHMVEYRNVFVLDDLLKTVFSLTSFNSVCDPFYIQEHSLIFKDLVKDPLMFKNVVGEICKGVLDQSSLEIVFDYCGCKGNVGIEKKELIDLLGASTVDNPLGVKFASLGVISKESCILFLNGTCVIEVEKENSYRIYVGTFARNTEGLTLTVSQMWHSWRTVDFTTCILHPMEVETARIHGELDMKMLNLSTSSNNFWRSQGRLEEPKWSFVCLFSAEYLASIDWTMTHIPPFKHVLNFLSTSDLKLK
jgi:hypothetical protein